MKISKGCEGTSFKTSFKQMALQQPHRVLPKRIILVRHGESQGNVDYSAFTTTPDYRIPLTELGCEQARAAGEKIRLLLSDGGRSPDWKVYCYVSPYEQTRSTLREMGKAFSKRSILGVREECRIREQDFGNFQVEERMKVTKETRERFGRFFFRFPEGFMESLWRDIDMNRLSRGSTSDLNLIIISHGLTSRVFLTKWFKWTVDQFESLNNFDNCEYRVMQLGPAGDYSLAVHHTREEMEQWGLCAEMIADQQRRASTNRGDWHEAYPTALHSFFDSLPDSDEDIVKEEDVIR
ncbi:phosphoglycerate mutase-like protein AT74 isoform X2 [Aristolochia californica]|uniref:phosphoglycerate mutase-like protein AT74 isoform X2 n=1 Tax=Aristolochia californica TaxID=171875 RepID=UPI0035D83DE3